MSVAKLECAVVCVNICAPACVCLQSHRLHPSVLLHVEYTYQRLDRWSLISRDLNSAALIGGTNLADISRAARSSFGRGSTHVCAGTNAQ